MDERGGRERRESNKEYNGASRNRMRVEREGRQAERRRKEASCETAIPFSKSFLSTTERTWHITLAVASISSHDMWGWREVRSVTRRSWR